MVLTTHLDTRSAINIINAQNHAAEIGATLNHFYTINFGHFSVEDREAGIAWRNFLQNRYNRTLRRHKPKALEICEPCYVWVLENQAGRIHAHWLVNVPLTFQQKLDASLEGWLIKEAGIIYSRKEAINKRTAPTPKKAVNYMMKGMRGGAAKVYGIDPKYCGPILGKRAGHSMNLGPTAIASYWKQKEEPRPAAKPHILPKRKIIRL